MTKPRGVSIKTDLSNATGSNCVYGALRAREVLKSREKGGEIVEAPALNIVDWR